ncbi:MAG: pyridoxine 5'-phosphate synthase [Gammaproteobacteria bacterium]
MKPVLLGVNIDHIATLRQMRMTPYPDLLQAAEIVIAAGADSLTIHLREDRRHIQDQDVLDLKASINVPMNLEMAVTEEMLGIAEAVKPEFCCFVPERRQELTTEGGLDVAGNKIRIAEACKRMSAAGIRASLFIDADEIQIQAAAEVGAGVIEIHTGHYADASDDGERNREMARINTAAALANGLGLEVNAGHGLNYENVRPVAALETVHELNIGHAIVARAVFTGLAEAVTTMKQIISMAR